MTYNTIEQIKKLRDDKHVILNKVYQSNDPDIVYNNQKELGSMSINIFTDVANVVMPALQKDGVGVIVWSNISDKVKKLSFISIPTASEIRENHKNDRVNPASGAQSQVGTNTYGQIITTPVFWSILAIEVIAVLLIVSFVDGSGWLLIILTALVFIELVMYFDFFKTFFAPHNEIAHSAENYNEMYRDAIQKVYRDNRKKLDDWFDDLERITAEEIGKALKAEN